MSKIPPPPEPLAATPVSTVPAEVRTVLSQDIINNLVLNGDLSKLSPADKTAFYLYRCQTLGLDPATKPFDLLKLSGKEVLYANKSCAANLRAKYGISTTVIGESEWNGVLVIRVRAWYPDGRQHEDEGFATLAGLSGDALGNARLKAITKATRRAILHLCGLGEMDETEVETIPGATKVNAFTEARNVLVQQTIGGSDAIHIVDIKGADANTDRIEVLDDKNRVWYFEGREAQDVAFKANGQAVPVMIDYTKEGGQNVVRTARM